MGSGNVEAGTPVFVASSEIRDDQRNADCATGMGLKSGAAASEQHSLTNGLSGEPLTKVIERAERLATSDPDRCAAPAAFLQWSTLYDFISEGLAASAHLKFSG